MQLLFVLKSCCFLNIEIKYTQTLQKSILEHFKPYIYTLFLLTVDDYILILQMSHEEKLWF